MPTYCEMLPELHEKYPRSTYIPAREPRKDVKRSTDSLPKDPNAAYAAKCTFAPAEPLPTPEELKASLDKFFSMPPIEVYKDHNGDPAGMLFEACKHLRDDHVKQLLEEGAPTTYADKLYGYTPLHIAAVNGREEQVARLLDAGASASATDIDGKTPLDLATESRHQIAQALLMAATPIPSA